MPAAQRAASISTSTGIHVLFFKLLYIFHLYLYTLLLNLDFLYAGVAAVKRLAGNLSVGANLIVIGLAFFQLRIGPTPCFGTGSLHTVILSFA